MKIFNYLNYEVEQKNFLYEALEINIEEKNIISFVGGGGKTTSIYTLAKELSKLGKKVVVTTTTHMHMPEDFIDFKGNVNEIIERFKKNETKAIISTTVIEVGVNVPNASMIVIFNANMFGLSTLHQLRGRVGRSDIQSYCVLVAKESEERLRLLEKTSDGFEISEYDFQNRGEGDLFGIKQSGELVLKMANIRIF